MSLTQYNQKRDFKKTKEPKGVKRASKKALRFVVQKHAASHLHYDFRLEIDGVLVSWAVPKGPSANPSDKRLAMHVEDHPMDYIDFEGTIPKGEYGGGTVMVWDIGTYEPEGGLALPRQTAEMKKQHRAGAIKIILKGEKLKGSWALVKMNGRGENQWLLIKHKDAFSGAKVKYDPDSILTGRDFDAIAAGDSVWNSNRKEKKAKTKGSDTADTQKKKAFKNKPTDETESFTADDLAEARKLKSFPKDWRPQLATLTDAPFDDADWLFEVKFDGYRSTAEINGNAVALISRNGLSFNDKFAEIAKTLKNVGNDMILDGEIVVEDSKGKSHFQWLQNHKDNPDKGTLKYYVFDILYFQGYDLRGLDLLQRKKILKAVLPELQNIVYSAHSIGTGTKAFKAAEKQKGEGIIAKKISSKYSTGKRNKDWLKIKTAQQQEMVIGGFTSPSGSRVGIGALLCGYYDGQTLVYAGKVGSGYTDETLKALRIKLDKIKRKTCPFDEEPNEKNVHWVKPELVAQIKFSEFTETGSMRHPVFLGLREDKEPNEVHMETALKPAAKKGSTVEDAFGRVQFSNTDKIFWPKEKITKGDVIAYYDKVAELILPYLKDRPQSLRRTPDGLKSDGFFQKNVAGTVPKWIKTRKIKSDSKSESIEWLLCQDKETLLFLANYGCIEINPWSSRVGSLNNPDFIIFDLDPKDAPIENLVKTARTLKKILDHLSVKAYLKTSGGNGLHVFIPVEPKYTYAQTREFSHLVSQMVHRELPQITSLERMPSKRKGKVYLDYLQNGRGKTMASVYSLRPREGATVSTSLEWDELTDALDLKEYNIQTVPERLAKLGDLWRDFFDSAIDLKRILENL